MKQLLLICAVVALVGCWKKEAPKEENRVRVQRVTPKPEPPKAVPEKLIINPILEKAIRDSYLVKKPNSELTKSDLEKVTRLDVRENQLTDVKGLEKLTQLTMLNLNSNQLTDVKGLEKLTKLTYLFLDGNQLTNVKGLEKLTKLKELWLGHNQLTDMKGLEKLTQLTWLSLGHNQLTDVKGLEKLTQLKILFLFNNPDLSKAQIAQLQKALPKCKISSNPPLNAEESAKVIEAAIREQLKKPTGELTEADLEKVTILILSDNQLTDVKDLEKLTRLEKLNLLFNPGLTKAQIDELQKALPNCKIDSNPTK